MITATIEAGAEVQRGATVTSLDPGSPSIVKFQQGGQSHEVGARLIAAADGRISVARTWAKFTVEQDPPSLVVAGVLLDNSPMPEDVNYLLMTNPMSYQGAYMFPQDKGRVRAYLPIP